MKVQLKSLSKLLLKRILPAMIIVCLMAVPGIMFGQNPGDNPDARPPEVPLDPKMTLLLIVAGAIVAMKVIRKQLSRQVVTNNL